MRPMNPLVSAALCAALAVPVQGALAAQYSYSLSGRTSDIVPTSNPPWVGGFGPLTNAGTADGLLPAMQLAVGDDVAVSIHFDQALAVPASLPGSAEPYQFTFVISLQGFDYGSNPNGGTVYYSSAMQFFDHGVEVGPGLAQASGSGGYGGGGYGVAPIWQGQTAAFSFDTVVATAHVDTLFGGPSNQPVPNSTTPLPMPQIIEQLY